MVVAPRAAQGEPEHRTAQGVDEVFDLQMVRDAVGAAEAPVDREVPGRDERIERRGDEMAELSGRLFGSDAAREAMLAFLSKKG